MRKLMMAFILIMLPGVAFGLEQSFTQQGLKATVKLSPEKLETDGKAQLSLKLNKDGTAVTDREVILEVYERNADQPIIKRRVDILDAEYIDAWKFENAGDYKIVIKIRDLQKPDEIIQYELMATVRGAGEGHGFFAHHFSGEGEWGWWGAGLMIIMMVPMMVLVL
ncbi:MAG: hypothetical protein HYV06_02495 [Deltaproteobacteria bacterium]|nr:hypothetical protein [Deltaproteobacteria bacterium]